MYDVRAEMNAVSQRFSQLIEDGESLANVAETQWGYAPDSAGFLAFRVASLTFLSTQLGRDHSYYSEFERLVNECRGDHIRFGVGLLRAAKADIAVRESTQASLPAFESLLHPIVTAAALARFHEGDYREAIFRAVTAVFDSLRLRTGLTLDGGDLATAAFAPSRPRLVVSNISTESGKSEQVGVMRLLEGIYSAGRNPKAHTLLVRPTREVAAQYLVVASLLARHIADAQVPEA